MRIGLAKNFPVHILDSTAIASNAAGLMAVSQGRVKIFVVRSHGGSVHSFQTCGNREELPFFLVLMIGKKKVDIFKTFHEDKVNILFTVQLGFFWPFHAQMQLFRL